MGPKTVRNLPGRLWLKAALIMAISAIANLDSTNWAQVVPNKKQARPDSFLKPTIIEFHGPIGGGMLRYFKSRIDKAREAKADLIVVEIESPGGRLDESYKIAEMLRDIDWAYTIAYSNSEAISGAALITFACDETYLSSEARLGDIGVIYHDPGLFAFRLVPAKIQSDVVTFARTLAEAKGRPPQLVEAMIDKDVLVFQREKENGDLEFMTHRVDEPNRPVKPWELVPESGPERFLEVNGVRAVELGLATGNVATRGELAAELGLKLENFVVYRYKAIDTISNVLNNPFVTGLLVVVGFLALYLELSAPGIGVGGIIAALCAVLFFWSRFMGGTAGILEVLLFLAGITFILMELFVIPGWGLSGILGLLLLFTSVILASQNFVVPQTAQQWNESLTTLMMISIASCLVLIGAAFITKKIGKIPVFNQMVLLPPKAGDSVDAKKKFSPGDKPSVPEHPVVSLGDWGVTNTVLRPSGRAIFAGRSIEVVSDGDFVDPGRQVRVVRIQGSSIVVTEVASDASTTESDHRGLES